MSTVNIDKLPPSTYITNASSAFERFTHWALAGSCIVLFITGMGFMSSSANKD